MTSHWFWMIVVTSGYPWQSSGLLIQTNKKVVYDLSYSSFFVGLHENIGCIFLKVVSKIRLYAMSTSLLSGPGRIAVPALTWTRDLVLRDLRISPSEILHRHDITANVQTNNVNLTKNSRNWDRGRRRRRQKVSKNLKIILVLSFCLSAMKLEHRE